MIDRRFVKPAPGLTVRDPADGGAPLPPHGKAVVWNSFWQRRLDEAAIVPTTEKEVDAAVKKAAAAQAAAAQAAQAAAEGKGDA